MTAMRLLGSVVCLFLLSGCTYHAEVRVSPPYSVYSDHGEPIPGHWVVHVDTQNLEGRVIKTDGLLGRAHNFAMDIAAPFKKSVLETVSKLVEKIELVDAPLSTDALSRSIHLGQIAVRVESFDPKIRFELGWWTNSAHAEVELETSIAVDGSENRLLEATVSSEGDSEGSSGAFGEGGANVLANAAEEAIEKNLERLREQISNSKKIRKYTDNVDAEGAGF